MICENCGKEHDGNYGSGRFCCKECARSFSSKNSKGELKEAKCIDCGKIIYIGKRASEKTCRCKECNKIHHKPSDLKKCKICGSLYYKNEGGCKNEFCKNHNIQQFKSLIKYFSFDKTKLGTLEVEEEFNRIRDLLYDLYWNKGLTAEEIGNFFKYKNSHNIIQTIFSYLNISTRNYSKAVINGHLKGKFDHILKNQYKCSWHTTWNGKEVYFRSSYELDYAKELDNQKIEYEVEYFHIKYFDTQINKYRCAIPDFYIPSTNTIIEIKSEYTLDKQNMKDKMKAYLDLGYNFKLICDHKEIEI